MPNFVPKYNHQEQNMLAQLLGFQEQRGRANLAENQGKYYNALQQLENAKVPYANDKAKAQMEHELIKNFWKQQQGLKEQAHAQNLPGDYASKRSLRGAQAGASNAAAALSHTKRKGQEGTNQWQEALRGNPLYQAKTVGGRLDPLVVSAISGQAASGNSPLQMSPVNMQGLPIGAEPQNIEPLQGNAISQNPPNQQGSMTPQNVPTQQNIAMNKKERNNPMSRGVPFANNERKINDIVRNQNQLLPQQEEAIQQQKTMYEKAFPQLMSAINNKLYKAQLANPAAAQKMQYLTNIKETIAGINPEAVKAYSGAAGRAELRRDQGLSALGYDSPKYNEFVEFVDNQAVILASQIRQFYGDSIQPKKEQQIMETFSAENIYKNPEAALKKMAEIIRIVESEGKTYAKPVGELIHEANNLGFGKQWDSILSEHKESKEKIQNKGNKKVKPLTQKEMKEAKELEALGQL